MKNITLWGLLTFFIGVQLGSVAILEPIRFWIWLAGFIGWAITFFLVLFTKE